MIANFTWAGNWLARRFHGSGQVQAAEISLGRPPWSDLAQAGAVLPEFVQACPMARKYLALLGGLDWVHFPERETNHPWPGSAPLPRAPFVMAYLVKLDQQFQYMSQLRQFLLDHPALIWLLGFPLKASSGQPYGFDPEASLPTTRLFLEVLRRLPNQSLQYLLDQTVTTVTALLPAELAFADQVAGDTKHILAWVKENNPKVFIKEGRFDKTKQPKADPDCKLGCKKKHNQKVTEADPCPTQPTPTTNPVPANTVEVGEYYWGYGSGIIATLVPEYGEFVLAELTQTFDNPDITYFLPLLQQVQQRLGHKPKFGAFDAAFDAFYVYEYFHLAGGFAAVPFVERGGIKSRSFDEQTHLPLCQAGLAMPLKLTFTNYASDVTHERGRYVCPLLFPQPTGQPCPINHKNWPSGGCITTMATSVGARLRYQLDRESQAYKLLYNQRTVTERIFARAVQLGIERPKLRNQRAITNQNTLIYVLLNLYALERLRARLKKPIADRSA